MSDRELICNALTAAGFRCEIAYAADEEEFRTSLAQGPYELILSDFTLPSYRGDHALSLAQQHQPFTPFLFVSGTIGEERAVESLKNGASDYVLKERMERLLPAVQRALREATERAKRREAEADLHRMNETLESRVQERTTLLQAAMADLEAFSYSVSHDLRVPLRAVDGFARILEESYGPKLDDDGRRLVATIRSQAGRMQHLIADLLAFSQAGRRPVDASEVDMTELARSAFLDLTEMNPPSNLDFTVEPLPATHGDRAMLRQVLVNLLGNAVKFSSRRERPVIVVSGRKEAGEAIYSVQDNGVGFNPLYADRLFGVFQRLHPKSEFDGTGVGLALVQRIVHRHGGRVWAQSQPNEGATFSFSLPGAQPSLGTVLTAVAPIPEPLVGERKTMLCSHE